MKTLQFVSGLVLVIVGIYTLTHDEPQYLYGGGLVVWGGSSLAQAWFAKLGKQEKLTSITYLGGIILTLLGVFLRK